MATGELNPNFYPAQRAAKVVQHYLNTRCGSPHRAIGLQKVHSANAQVCYLTGRVQLTETGQYFITINCVLFLGCGLRENVSARALGAGYNQQCKI